ncbi:DUF427 domain-containing protein [Nitriliruptoria bacterium AS10]|nr:DUF427 domain-containing protein [Salsipaludibacter albus]
MATARFNDTVIADSDDAIMVEGALYFPPEDVNTEYLREISKTEESWRGTAHYSDVIVAGQVVPSGAWHYPEAADAALDIEGYYAFWNGVEVTS